jgi:hypothetical protein
MANTYTLISSNVLSSSATTITFSSIPQTYTDLVLRTSAVTDETSQGYYDCKIKFNNDSTSTIWSWTRLRGDGSAASSARGVSETSLNALALGGSQIDSTNKPAFSELYIPNYTASRNKAMSYSSASERNTTTSQMYSMAFLWRDTSAISRIDVFLTGANFISGSSFYLYGIKNS